MLRWGLCELIQLSYGATGPKGSVRLHASKPSQTRTGVRSRGRGTKPRVARSPCLQPWLPCGFQQEGWTGAIRRGGWWTWLRAPRTGWGRGGAVDS